MHTGREYLNRAWSLALSGSLGVSLVYVALPIAVPESVPSAHAQKVGVPGGVEEKTSDTTSGGSDGSSSESAGREGSTGEDQSTSEGTSEEGQDATAIMGVNTASTVRVNNLANLEAVLNILANGLEIWGLFIHAPSLLLGAIVAFVRHHYFLGVFLLISVPASVTLGLASPALINWIAVSSRDAGMEDNLSLMAVVVALVWAALLFVYGFIPACYAFAGKHSQKWLIFGTTFFSWIVVWLGWPALLFWALYDPKREKEKQPYLPPELRS